MQAERFLALLYPNLKGKVEVRAFDRATSTVAARTFCESREAVLAETKALDEQGLTVYFECPVLKPSAQNGQQDSVLHYPFLYADLDLVRKEHGVVVETFSKEQVRARIEASPAPPSLVVDSGHGFHCYWLLDMPQADKAMVQHLLKRLQEHLLADPKASLLTQLLRLPGTRNRKQEGEDLIVQVVGGSERRWKLGDLARALGVPLQPQAKVPASSRAPQGDADVVFAFDMDKRPTPLGLTATSSADLMRILKQQNPLLASSDPNRPLGRAFRCILHDDQHPSANIYRDKESQGGDYLYKCFSGKHQGESVMDIVSLYRKVKGVGLPTALKDLAAFFGIDYPHSDWADGQLHKYAVNADQLDQFETSGLAARYPALYHFLKPRRIALLLLNSYALGKVSWEQNSHEGESLFFFSYAYFTKQYGGTISTFSRTINLFVTLGLLDKVPLQEVPMDMARKALDETRRRTQALHLQGSQPVNFYTLPLLDSRFRVANERAELLLAHRFKLTTNMNKMFLIRAMGQEEADRVYPDERTITPVSRSIAIRLESTLKHLVEEQGYATKDQVVSKTKVSGRLGADRERKERELDRYFSQFLTENHLEYVKVDKALKEMLQIQTKKNNSFPFVIIPRGLRT